MSQLFDKSIGALDKALDMYLLRHAVISDNIANAETPNFKARRVNFEEALDRAVQEGNTVSGAGAALDSVKADVVQDPDAPVGQDLNSVDMDREMAKLTQNDVQYSAATQAVSRKFALLKYAISEGTDR